MNLREKAYLCEKAYCLALKPDVISKYCSKCVKSDVECKLSRCAACKSIYYCRSECQKADWSLHKIECNSIKSLNEIGHESYRLVLRIHFKSKGEVKSTEEHKKRSFNDLLWHPSVTTEQLEYKKWKEGFRKFSNADINDKRLDELYGKMSVNSFALTNQYTLEIGLALCIQLSAIDHSCKPNARIAFLGDEAIMVPTGGLSTNLLIEGAMHSYINEMMPRDQRRKNLKERYNFECTCAGCNDEIREKNMTGYECENCAKCVEIGGICKSCNFTMSPDQKDLCNLNKEMANATINALLKSNHVSSGQHETRLQICKKTLEVMEGVLYKYNIFKYIVLRNAFTSALFLNDLNEAEKYGNELLNIQKFYQSSNDLSLISLKHSLANLSLRLNNKSAALQYLKEIKESLLKIYGPNTLIVNDVNSMISKCC